ncbi:hypothetical protein ACF3NR_03470 [Vaginella massiliensis]|uniref:hypothetical protein n=1 Tax=Vaginella massiliensis TaxID=1816680 RepID=UPI003751611D
MKKPFLIIAITASFSTAWSQVNSSNLTYPNQNEPQKNESNLERTTKPDHNRVDMQRWRFGGGLGLGFGNNGYFAVGIIPSVGYIISEQFEGGLILGYTYSKDDYVKQNTFNVGPYVNYFPISSLFLRANYMYYTGKVTFDNANSYNYNFDESALWLGGGYQSSGAVRFQIGMMYNVLYDKKSSRFATPWQPIVGVSFGF